MRTVAVLGDISPLCSAVAAWLACVLYTLILKPRFGGWRRWLAVSLFLPAFYGVMYAASLFSGLLYNLLVLLSALLMLAMLGLCCRGDAYKAVYFCARAFLLANFAAALGWQLHVNFVGVGLYAEGALLPRAIAIALVFAAVFSLMYLLERRHQRESRALHLTLRESVTVVLMAYVFYIISTLSFSTLEVPFVGSTEYDAVNTRALVLLGGVAILYAYHLQLAELHAKREADTLQTMLHLQYSNYQISQQAVELINQKYHDLKHQIAVLRTETSPERKNAYLDSMEQDIRAYEAQNKTGNQVLDTVLTAKGLYCQTAGIHMTCVADGSLLDFMDIIDISTLFGNALDNAIENVQKLADEEKRLIHVAVGQHSGCVRIRVENCYAGDVVFEGGLPKTTKRDARFHGFGLKSIQSTAKKYGGSMTVQAKDGWFELRVLIPLPA